MNALSSEVSSMCAVCGKGAETVHLFLHCELQADVWTKVMLWLEYSFLMPPNLFIHWACWNEEESKKKIKKGFWLIWHCLKK